MLGTFYQKTIFISDKKVVDFYLSFPEGDAVLIGFSGRSDYHIGKARTADRLHDLARLVNDLLHDNDPHLLGSIGDICDVSQFYSLEFNLKLQDADRLFRYGRRRRGYFRNRRPGSTRGIGYSADGSGRRAIDAG